MLRAQKGLITRAYLLIDAADGTPGAPSVLPTVTVTSARTGDELIPAGTATGTIDTGLYYYDLSPATPVTGGVTAQLDELTVDWEYTLAGAAQTVSDRYEVVGQRLAGPSMLTDRLDRGGDADDYSARSTAAALQYAEQAFEEACGRALTTRWRTVTLDGTGTTELFLPDYPLQSLLTATISGTAVDVDDVTVYEDGRLYYPSGWTAGRGNIVVTYEHGPLMVPPPVSRAVALIASSVLADGPWDDREFGVTTDGGFVRLLTAGVSGAAFSIPEVQAAVHAYRRKFPNLAVRV